MRRLLLGCLIITLLAILIVKNTYAWKVVTRTKCYGVDPLTGELYCVTYSYPWYEEGQPELFPGDQLYLDLWPFPCPPICPPDPWYLSNITVPDGWTYETDNMTYISVYVPEPISTPGVYGPISWVGRPRDLKDCYWEVRDINGTVLETGNFLPFGVVGGATYPYIIPANKPDFMTFYTGVASIILIGAMVTAIYAKYVKRRRQKQ